MDPSLEFLLVAFFIILIFVFCILSLKSIKNFSKNEKERIEQLQRHRWNSFVLSQDPKLKESVIKNIEELSDEEFEKFIQKIHPLLKHKYYRNNPTAESTRIKRGIYNAVNSIWMNKFSRDLDRVYKRAKTLENELPLLKRVYFGPKYTARVYSKRNWKSKFHFTLKSGEEIPKLNTIVDVAYFLNASVNFILAIIYTQSAKKNTHYIKLNQIDKALRQNGQTYSQMFGQVNRSDEFNSSSPDLTRVNIVPKHVELDQNFVLQEKINKTEEMIENSEPVTENIDEIREEPETKISATIDSLDYKEEASVFYSRKFLIKPDGRKRLLAIPNRKLVEYQRKILREILEKAELLELCTGFVKTRSIVNNARFHIGAQTLVKMDLRNFFNNISFDQVFQVFRGFGYNRPVSGILASVCTDFYRERRYLPQGSPSSPMIANLYAIHMDKRLKGLWSKHGFQYSRYADDLAFSGADPKAHVHKLIQATYEIIKEESLYPNFEKTRVLRKQHKKSVTGITVNEKINIDRKWMNELRGELYRYSKFGLPEENPRVVFNQLQGKLTFLNMVNPDKAKKYQPYILKLVDQTNVTKTGFIKARCAMCGKEVDIKEDHLISSMVLCEECKKNYEIK